MARTIWYRNYENFLRELEAEEIIFKQNCERLGIGRADALSGYRDMMIAKAVHESNWQEGIELEEGKTKKFAKLAFEEFKSIENSPLNLVATLDAHASQVLMLYNSGAREQEVGAYNLAMAHRVATWLIVDMLSKQLTGIRVRVIKNFSKIATERALTEDERLVVDDHLRKVSKEISDDTPSIFPLCDGMKTQGEYSKSLLGIDLNELGSPFRVEYIHFLHKIIMMGISDEAGCGRFRAVNVHVSNPDVLFPIHEAVPAMMGSYVKGIVGGVDHGDIIMYAARMSHSFVEIHPYEDGDGRLSRVIMNMIFTSHHPPVYLKANKKGAWALCFCS